MSGLLIRHAHLIDLASGVNQMGDIRVEGERVSEIGMELPVQGDRLLDADGLCLAPGLVDMHVHLRDPGLTYKEDIESGCEAAAAGGVTSVAVMPNTVPAADSPDTIRYILEKGKKAKSRVLPVAAVTKGLAGKELTCFSALKQAGAIAFSDDGNPVATAYLMAEAMKRAAALQMPVLAHCEDRTLTRGGLIHEGDISKKLGVPGVPAAAEDVGTAREIALALSLGVPVHICHVSTAASVSMIRAAKSLGVQVTAETCPHYFLLTQEKLLSRDADYRMSPPLRPESDRLAVLEGLRDGTIDAIATDHAPHAAAEKADFEKAPNGVVGLETSLAAGITFLVERGVLSLPELLYRMSAVPAHILRVPCGTLTEGGRADLVLFDPQESWTADPACFHGKSHNSALKGMKLQGRVKYTICRGEVVYRG